jgi:hypothetical protein
MAGEQVGEGVAVELALVEDGDQAARLLGVVGPLPRARRQVGEVDGPYEMLRSEGIADTETGQALEGQGQSCTGEKRE